MSFSSKALNLFSHKAFNGLGKAHHPKKCNLLFVDYSKSIDVNVNLI